MNSSSAPRKKPMESESALGMRRKKQKKSMENFMDITSHEMRNPLSAIIQSADGIASSLLEFQDSSKSAIRPAQLVESTSEAIQIITVRDSPSL